MRDARSVTIYIASHQYVDLPCLPDYQPLYVGAYKLPQANRDPGWLYDDSGIQSISSKNARYCELTGLYWIWRHATSDIVGLVHYRRFLCTDEQHPSIIPLSACKARELLDHVDIITTRPAACLNRGLLVTAAEDYRMHHVSTDLVILRDLVRDCSPDYLEAFNQVFYSESICPCNIVICRRELLASYCSWLFPLLDKLETALGDISYRDSYQQRVYGFLAERLFNVFIRKNNLSTVHLGMFDPLDDWKAMSFPDPRDYSHRERICCKSGPLKALKNRKFNKVFDMSFYINHYEDLYAVYSQDENGAREHFLTFGLRENRMAHPGFSIASYQNGHPELRSRFGDECSRYLEHYLSHPEDRNRAIGFENTPLSSDCLADRAKLLTARARKALTRAEAEGVLD